MNAKTNSTKWSWIPQNERRAARTGMLGLLLLALVLGLMAAGARAEAYNVIRHFGIMTNLSGFSPRAELVQGPDGTLYGTTSEGWGMVGGTVFKVQPDGSGFTALKCFTNLLEGASPEGGLVLDGGTLYGTTTAGGSLEYGTVFKVNTDGTGYTVLKNFALSDGASPRGTLVLSGGTLYGTTYYGGAYSGGGTGYGVVFKVDTNGMDFTVLKSFNYDEGGGHPIAGLVLDGDTLYGTASGAGLDYGEVFSLNTNGTGCMVLKRFHGGDGDGPCGRLTLVESMLYGTTACGGIGTNAMPGTGWGTVFCVSTGGGHTVLRYLTSGDGTGPCGALVCAGGALYGTASAGGGGSSGTIFKLDLSGTGFTVLKTFAASDGAQPYAGLIASGATLYGTTLEGGTANKGTVFKVNTDGTAYTVLKHMTPGDAAQPVAGLALGEGTLYGTTEYGGAGNVGTLYEVNTDGSGYAVIKEFNASDGEFPSGELLLSGGVLYGTASGGGSGSGSGAGTVFKVNPDGTGFTMLKAFAGGTDGALPLSGLVLANGTLYGTTYAGGAGNAGTVFKVKTNGTGYAKLANVGGLQWEGPQGGLVLDGNTLFGTTETVVFKVSTNGGDYTQLAYLPGRCDAGLALGNHTLYGTTAYGGTADRGTVFKILTDGTGFAVLKNFGGPDGSSPSAALVLNGSTLYGVTSSGGSAGQGTVFKLNTDGTRYAVLKSFSGADGANPLGDLVLSGGKLYGTTSGGGALGWGTVFSLDICTLQIQAAGNRVILTWSDPGQSLQCAPQVAGAYTNVPGATSPYTNSLSGQACFFRLLRH